MSQKQPSIVHVSILQIPFDWISLISILVSIASVVAFIILTVMLKNEAKRTGDLQEKQTEILKFQSKLTTIQMNLNTIFQIGSEKSKIQDEISKIKKIYYRLSKMMTNIDFFLRSSDRCQTLLSANPNFFEIHDLDFMTESIVTSFPSDVINKSNLLIIKYNVLKDNITSRIEFNSEDIKAVEKWVNEYNQVIYVPFEEFFKKKHSQMAEIDNQMSIINREILRSNEILQ